MPDGGHDGAHPGGPAPFHAHLAGSPAEASWVRAADGARLRVVRWGHGSRGTVLLLPGRAEWAEKYGRVGADLAQRGWVVVAPDWRGQGLSERTRGGRGPVRAPGHVGRWWDYQLDVAALVERADGLPRPWHLLAHSMGGLIGLRALHEGLPVATAAFSAPMWGLDVARALRPSRAAAPGRGTALGRMLQPSRHAVPYLLRAEFADNVLTGDLETFEWMRAQVVAEPALGLGGASLHWLGEALREMRRLLALPAPRVRAVVLLGTEEGVVDPGRVRARAASWPGARLVTLAGARHEPLMEAPAIRARAMAEVEALFAGA